ncbi:MAG: 1-acyl-sn-glycerol-3-phosphate acyltransferase [Candidatus Bipolaricaulota bacterium]|nr:1-acyl-sn-glycerol-3-phosphate acyltransferase [Candidatus Bipolaricaulota bacterium]MDW8127232.1 lysophospholipid acyltransferase family protein [Candidatus Bipolaricaulota bacterium]
MKKLLRAVFVGLGLEPVWFMYWLFMWVLTSLVRTQRAGSCPKRPCVLAVIHLGGLEPLFVTRASRHWRGWALYTLDWPNPLVRFLCQAFWRFGVTQDPKRKAAINPKTIKRATEYLRSGGSLMVFPEGVRLWERRLYPGAALLARRAGVPLIPVGLENAPIHEPGPEKLPVWRGFPRALWKTVRKRRVVVHFAEAILPDPKLSEEEDVDRMMRELERVFRDFYQRFYGVPGPVWINPRRAR